jgi:DNA polymerase-4
MHLDLDAFFCAVEEKKQPSLRGKPFAVGGKPGERGVVSSCSYPARQFGVRSAMPMGRAMRLCPELIVLPGDYKAYSAASRQVMQILRDLTDQVEQISIDEAFLDVSEFSEPTDQIARQLQQKIHQELGLPCSLGVASNKLVAKIANDFGKIARRGPEPPNAITIVPPGEEAAFLAPLPTEALWGVGPKTAERLAEMNILTIGDIAACPEEQLKARFGKTGWDLSQRSRGLDDRPITTEHEAKSISQETTFARDIRDESILVSTLLQHSQRVGQRLRQAHLTGTTIRLKLRWADFQTLTRQTTLSQPTDQDEDIYRAAEELFHRAWQPKRPVRLIGVGISGLGPQVHQLSFLDIPSKKNLRLAQVVEELRQRYGEEVFRKVK